MELNLIEAAAPEVFKLAARVLDVELDLVKGEDGWQVLRSRYERTAGRRPF